jgi:hypothetical protein
MANRSGRGNTLIGVVLGAILVLLLVFVFFSGALFEAIEPAEVDGEVPAIPETSGQPAE